MENPKKILIVLMAFLAFFITGCGKQESGEVTDSAQSTESTSEDQSKMDETQTDQTQAEFTLKSLSYEDGGQIPVKHANVGVNGGANASPAFEWDGEPDGTKYFALVIYDKHPVASNWIHWVIVNIPAAQKSLAESVAITSIPGAEEGFNSFGDKGYGGPQPPAGSGPHEYVTKICALSEKVSLEPPVSLDSFQKAVEGKVLGEAEMSGTFER